MFKVSGFYICRITQSAKMADKGTTKNANMQEKRVKTCFMVVFSSNLMPFLSLFKVEIGC